MSIYKMLFSATALAALFAAAGFAQNQKEPNTVRGYCVKAAPGKAAQLEAFVRDVWTPVEQARADAGEVAWVGALRAVVPAGETAPCDYRAVYGYRGLFPAPTSKEQLKAAIKRAHLNTTAQEFESKLESLGRLVKVDYWIGMGGTGTDQQKGYFVRLNHFQVKPSERAEWSRLEETYWKPLVASWTKAGHKGSWDALRLWTPVGEGDSQPYNAMTVDIFSNWNSLVHGLPVNQLWAKAHPHTDLVGFGDQIGRIASLHDSDVYKIIDFVTAKNATGK